MTHSIGERINIILKEQNIKKIEFAKALGISANYVYLITSGRKKIISETLAKLIESIYGYSYSWILTGELPKKEEAINLNLREDTLKKIENMTKDELILISDFIENMLK